ncbi:OLC1v1011056C1 [Oldenlandia corymbosa var. corymbosa]|uniref:Calmodulin-lysine N-methyltransferase n=1 Tax=Oldenlandia corymbosa var. corymbosa TaxID=529605 RepID=A0AAV1DSS9_OLDCO|nr:OLC1v1011056C1 [Oldenlandia corymbosa var. corymbosa]
MEATSTTNSSSSTPTSSSLRWKILRRALLRKHSSVPDDHSDMGLNRVSRKATQGFNLIPRLIVDDHSGEPSDTLLSRNTLLGSSKDAFLCYKLPIHNSPYIRLCQRVDDGADLNDFEVCNRHNIDNTGLVCLWPSEDVLAYYSLSNTDMFRDKRVIELGSGYGLAGLVIAVVTEALEVVITDGNPQVVDYIQQSIEANSGAFGGSQVKSMVLHWNHPEKIDMLNSFDIIVASDCTFFKEFHKDLARTIRMLLKKKSSSEAILLSPRRGMFCTILAGERPKRKHTTWH